MELCRRQGIDMPIVEAAYQVLYENAEPRQVIRTLLLRRRKAESEDISWI